MSVADIVITIVVYALAIGLTFALIPVLLFFAFWLCEEWGTREYSDAELKEMSRLYRERPAHWEPGWEPGKPILRTYSGEQAVEDATFDAAMAELDDAGHWRRKPKPQ